MPSTTQELLPFLGSYCLFVMRRSATAPPDDEGEEEEETATNHEGSPPERPHVQFAGVLAAFNSQTATLFGAFRIRQRKIVSHTRRSFARDAMPLSITARLRSMVRITRIAHRSLARIFHDPARRVSWRETFPAPDSAEFQAAQQYMLQVILRKYAAQEMRSVLDEATAAKAQLRKQRADEAIQQQQQQQRTAAAAGPQPPTQPEDVEMVVDGDGPRANTQAEVEAAEAAEAEAAAAERAEVSRILDKGITEALGGAEEDCTQSASEFTMPLLRFARRACDSLVRVGPIRDASPADVRSGDIDQRQTANREQQRAARGTRSTTPEPQPAGVPDSGAAERGAEAAEAAAADEDHLIATDSGLVVSDASPIADVLRSVPEILGRATAADLWLALRKECLQIESFLAPAAPDPNQPLRDIIDRFVRACFICSVCFGIFYCIFGGWVLGTALTGPTGGNTGLVQQYVSYLWYMLIVPGLTLAVLGVSLAARGEDAASARSRVRRVWVGCEVFCVVLMLPGVLFSIIWLSSNDTPRITAANPLRFWNAKAEETASALCKFMVENDCSGYTQVCYEARSNTSVAAFIAPGCAPNCEITTEFALDIPTRTCQGPFLAQVDSISWLVVLFGIALCVAALLRQVGLYGLRVHYTTCMLVARERIALAHFGAHRRHEAQQQQQQQEE